MALALEVANKPAVAAIEEPINVLRFIFYTFEHFKDKLFRFKNGIYFRQEKADRTGTLQNAYGKFKERYLIDLPEAYLAWFQRKGFPEGKLGEQMRAVLEIKINGLEGLIRKIREEFPLDTQ